MTAGKSLIEQCWDELDTVADEMTEDKTEFRVGYANGLAYAIQLLSQPHFADIKAVLTHENMRFLARRDHDETPLTPGCDGYSPMPLALRDLRKQ